MYYRVIIRAIYGTKDFFIITGVFLLSFSVALLALDTNLVGMQQRNYVGTAYEPLVYSEEDSGAFKAIFNQYMLVLGEFGVDSEALAGYPDAGRYLMWFYFILATFFLQQTLFTTFINVMGEEYN